MIPLDSNVMNNFCGWAIPGLLLLIVVDLQLSQTETLFPQMLRNKSLQIFWLNKGTKKVQKKELTERLAGFLDDWSCCWVKKRPANIMTLLTEKFLQKSCWKMVIGKQLFILEIYRKDYLAIRYHKMVTYRSYTIQWK